MIDVLWEGLYSRSSCTWMFPSLATVCCSPVQNHDCCPCVPVPWLLEEQTLCQHICGPRLQNTDFKCMKISILIGEKGEAKHRP